MKERRKGNCCLAYALLFLSQL